MTDHLERITITLPPDLLAKLDAEAKKENRSRSNMIVKILREKYPERKK